MDFPVPGLKDADEGLRAAEAFLKRWSGDPLIVPAVGPHAAYTVGPETLMRAKALADRYKAPLAIHAAEGPSEMAMVKEKYGVSTIHHFDRILPGPASPGPCHLAERRRDRAHRQGGSGTVLPVEQHQARERRVSGEAPPGGTSGLGTGGPAATTASTCSRDRPRQKLQKITTARQC
jgi:5-methylthioadenosine/S-adenosylhomocysteine deaminase